MNSYNIDSKQNPSSLPLHRSPASANDIITYISKNSAISLNRKQIPLFRSSNALKDSP